MSTRHHSTAPETRRRWQRWPGRVLVSLTLLFAFGACDDEQVGVTDDPNTPWVETQYSLMPASDCGVVKARVIDATTEQILQYRYNPPMMYAEDANSGSPRAGGTQSPTDYTTTNVQEAGVDEIDIIKTDGDFLYTVNGTDLVIVDSWPVTEVSEVSRVSLAEVSDSYGYASSPGLFLYGDKVVVFTQVYDYSSDPAARGFSGTRVTVVDVTDRTAPVVQRAFELEGWFTDARMIAGEVYAVSNSSLNVPFNLWDLTSAHIPGAPDPSYNNDEAAAVAQRDQARPYVRQRVATEFAGASVEDMLPRQRLLAIDGTVVSEGPQMACSDLYLPRAVTELGMLTVTHLSLEDAADPTHIGLLASGWELYASQDNLYVALSSRWWGWGWGWGSGETETHLHKFGLDGPDGEPAYVASGKVDGWLLNQFSMSEHNGYLRVATTDNTWQWDDATQTSSVTGGNHLTILAQSAGLLEEVGAVRDLAPGEEIYACRMMGDRAFVVTFRQTDPLFTLDLSDPTDPKLVGELHINGFSSYIHPLGANHLLTIGQDADATGGVTGVHLQIFDVTDMANPTRAHQQLLSTGSWSSWSEAMWDHHAFTYHPQREVLAIPINIYEWEANAGENFSGLLLFKANAADGFTEIGRVNHADLVTQSWCQARYGSWSCTPETDYQWWTTVRRSVFIEDYVYSLSDVGLKVNGLLTPDVQHAALVLQQ